MRGERKDAVGPGFSLKSGCLQNIITLLKIATLIQRARNQKCFGYQVFLIFSKYLHILNELSWAWGPHLNTKFIYVPYTP